MNYIIWLFWIESNVSLLTKVLGVLSKSRSRFILLSYISPLVMLCVKARF